MYKNLSMVQKAMVSVYKNGGTLPFLEKYVQDVALERAKAETQKAYAQAHESLIGNEEQRRAYWIKKMKE